MSVMHSANCSSERRTLKCADKPRTEKTQLRSLRLVPRLDRARPSMPVMNGFDAARVLKRLTPTVPLIMYSAFGDKLAEKQARLIGISEVVSKAEHAGVLIHKARGLLNSAAA
jgi:DNA-binding response OmpR family regulator